MSGRARAAVACRLRCRARPVLGVRRGENRAARRGPSAGDLPAATRAPPTNIPGHIPPQSVPASVRWRNYNSRCALRLGRMLTGRPRPGSWTGMLRGGAREGRSPKGAEAGGL